MFLRRDPKKVPERAYEAYFSYAMPALSAGVKQTQLQIQYNLAGSFLGLAWKWRYASGQELSTINQLQFPDGNVRLNGNLPIVEVGALSTSTDGEAPKPLEFLITNGQQLLLDFTPIANGAASSMYVTFFGYRWT